MGDHQTQQEQNISRHVFFIREHIYQGDMGSENCSTYGMCDDVFNQTMQEKMFRTFRGGDDAFWYKLLL